MKDDWFDTLMKLCTAIMMVTFAIGCAILLFLALHDLYFHFFSVPQ